MNLVERYALSTGLKIGKPFIYEKYFPLPVAKYITFHPVSKPAKFYDYWQDVLEDIAPILIQHGIHILQIGAREDHQFQRCMKVNGLTSINQAAYIIKRGLLHLSTDTFSAHMAGAFDKKLVALYSSSHTNNCKPYWGNPDNQILLEPPREDGIKPSFAFDEVPKQINRIKTEDISNAVLKLLGLKERVGYETVFVGDKYQNQIYFHNIIPNKSGYFLKQDEIEIRMDRNHDEEFLRGQLSNSRCAIIADKPFSENILAQYKPRIAFLFYVVSNEKDIEFCKKAIGMGIPIHFVSKLPQDEINALKIHYYGYGKIDKIPEIGADDLGKLKAHDASLLQFKSNKIYTQGQERFYSLPDTVNGHPCMVPHYKPITSPDFLTDGTLEDFQFFKFIKRLD